MVFHYLPYDTEGAVAYGAVGLHVGGYSRRLVVGRRRRQDGALRRALRTALHQRHGHTHGDARVPRGAAYSRHPTAPRLAVTADSSHGQPRGFDTVPRSPDRSRLTRDAITGYFFIIHARTTMRESLNALYTDERDTCQFQRLLTQLTDYFAIIDKTKVGFYSSFDSFRTKDETVVNYYYFNATRNRPHATEIERDWPAMVGGGSGTRARQKQQWRRRNEQLLCLMIALAWLASLDSLNTAKSALTRIFIPNFCFH